MEENNKRIVIRILGIDFLQILPLWIFSIIRLISNMPINKLNVAENTIVVAIVSDATIILQNSIGNVRKNGTRMFALTLCKEILLCTAALIYCLVLVAEYYDGANNLLNPSITIWISFVCLIFVKNRIKNHVFISHNYKDSSRRTLLLSQVRELENRYKDLTISRNAIMDEIHSISAELPEGEVPNKESRRLYYLESFLYTLNTPRN